MLLFYSCKYKSLDCTRYSYHGNKSSLSESLCPTFCPCSSLVKTIFSLTVKWCNDPSTAKLNFLEHNMCVNIYIEIFFKIESPGKNIILSLTADVKLSFTILLILHTFWKLLTKCDLHKQLYILYSVVYISSESYLDMWRRHIRLMNFLEDCEICTTQK